MRTTIRTSLIATLLGFGISASAGAQVSVYQTSRSVTCVVSAEVKSFVRLVAIAADPRTGASPRMMVVTNDPRIRAAMARPLTPEVLGPEPIAFLPERAGHGGESAVRGRFEAGATTVRYTITTP